MKKKKLVLVLIIVLAVLLIGAGIFFGLFYKKLFPKVPVIDSKDKNTDVVQITNGGNYVYLINNYDGYILIDAGTDEAALMKTFKQKKIDPAGVKYIFVTHSDADHTIALKDFPNATIYMWENEKQMLDGTTTKNGAQLALPEGITTDDITWVTDGQKIKINEHEIECIGTPGHTLGSMSFLVDSKHLFTGDAFQFVNTKLTVHVYSMDEETAKQSIDKIVSLLDRCEYVYTGHFSYKKAEGLHN